MGRGNCPVPGGAEGSTRNMQYSLNNLAWLLATCPKDPVRNGEEAVMLAQRADRLYGGKQAAALTHWPLPTPKQAGSRRLSQRPAKPWTSPHRRRTKHWRIVCGHGSPCTKPTSRFVRRPPNDAVLVS